MLDLGCHGNSHLALCQPKTCERNIQVWSAQLSLLMTWMTPLNTLKHMEAPILTQLSLKTVCCWISYFLKFITKTFVYKIHTAFSSSFVFLLVIYFWFILVLYSIKLCYALIMQGKTTTTNYLMKMKIFQLYFLFYISRKKTAYFKPIVQKKHFPLLFSFSFLFYRSNSIQILAEHRQCMRFP